MGHYIKTFINNTVSFQINDARQLPIVIPDGTQILDTIKLVREAINNKKQTHSDEHALEYIQNQVDILITKIYNLK